MCGSHHGLCTHQEHRRREYRGEGLLLATHKHPTYDEDHTTKVLKNNGDIYWLRDLQPVTLYYMRAYAKTANGHIG